jgi:hypothetical protein
VRSSNSSRWAACASNSADEHRRKWRYGTSGHTGHDLRADPASRAARRALVTWHASPTSTCNVGGLLQVAEGEKLQKNLLSGTLSGALPRAREPYSGIPLRFSPSRETRWSAAFSKGLMRLLQRKRSSPNGLVVLERRHTEPTPEIPGCARHRWLGGSKVNYSALWVICHVLAAERQPFPVYPGNRHLDGRSIQAARAMSRHR